MYFVMPQKPNKPLPKIKELQKPIGKRLAEIRKQAGLTQVELASKVGITQALLSSYERGRLGISGELILRFALAMNLSTDTLFGYKPDTATPPALTRKSIKRLREIDNLPVHQQKVLLKNIDMFLKGAKAG